MRRALRITLATAIVCVVTAAPARAQSHEIQIGGYVLVGQVQFTASESFKAIFDTASGPLFGGGATVGLPWFGGGLFVDVGGWRVKQDGERVFISSGTVFKLGIPVTVTVTPVEVTGGWRFRNAIGKLTPYVGAGFSSYGYKETSKFANGGEDVSDRFAGFHVLGGAEYRVMRLIGIGGEVAWSSIANAFDGGVAAEFNEDNLGGTSIRARITIGR